MGLTAQAQRPGAQDATIPNRDAMPGSLQRMVRALCAHRRKPPKMIHKKTSVGNSKASPEATRCAAEPRNSATTSGTIARTHRRADTRMRTALGGCRGLTMMPGSVSGTNAIQKSKSNVAQPPIINLKLDVEYVAMRVKRPNDPSSATASAGRVARTARSRTPATLERTTERPFAAAHG
jgi:hypothetical protein